jgi:hypothetical protein
LEAGGPGRFAQDTVTRIHVTKNQPDFTHSTLGETMPTKQQDQQRQAHEGPEGQRLHAVIAKQVMSTLGRPDDFQRVQVRPLWQDHYRVNVLVGVDAASIKVAHSYFMVAEGGGNIIASTPPLSRQY